MPVSFFLVLSAMLFSIGVYGVLARQHVVLVLLSVELMLNAANINFAAFANYWRGVQPGHVDGYVYALFSIAIAAAEAAVGLAILVNLHRIMNGIDVDRATALRW